MALDVRQFPCLSDNYGFIVRDEASGRTACVDTPDAEAILAALSAAGWGLDLVLNTHWHPDHAGGNRAVQAATGARIVGPEEVLRIAPLDQAVKGGDEIRLGDTRIQVIDCSGHTLGHVAYHAPEANMAFVGDTLFAMGCGRLFEGEPAQMWASLQRLAALPEQTIIFCAHEYTESNVRFALSLDSDPAVAERAQIVFEARRKGEPTVPTTIARERATNPFLRAPLLMPDAPDPVTAFAQVRSAKDEFKG